MKDLEAGRRYPGVQGGPSTLKSVACAEGMFALDLGPIESKLAYSLISLSCHFPDITVYSRNL